VVSITPFTHTLCNSTLSRNSVEVYENVFNDDILRLLDSELKRSGLGHTVFNFRQPRTCTESAISSFLEDIGDTSCLIEYWWREEWLSLDLHRDVDEELAKVENTFRYPKNGHVLYLSVGKEVNGPTIIIQEKNVTDNNFGSQNIQKIRPVFNNITIVPAVNGRMLRFEGNLLHAVPRPALAYLDHAEGTFSIWYRLCIV